MSEGLVWSGAGSAGRTSGVRSPSGTLPGGGLEEEIGGRRGRGLPVGRLLLTTLRLGGPADRVLVAGVRFVPKATVGNVVAGVGDEEPDD